eukprot:TRINITY_DN10404_c0_g1_i1.p1 TRINITY_DN10404_c0_g1~~TRINITY_DN10404_c0_g1_i1.p1  ORF type:complete len:497 (-),score=55.33 TRINITY_DN10404_c0_g1_i1:109-1599(-)
MSQTSSSIVSLGSSDFGAELEAELEEEDVELVNNSQISPPPSKRLKIDNQEYIPVGELNEETDDFYDYLTIQNPQTRSPSYQQYYKDEDNIVNTNKDTINDQNNRQENSEQKQSGEKEGVCKHPMIFHGLCAVCGQEVQEQQTPAKSQYSESSNKKSSVALKYLHKGLRISTQQIQEMKELNANELLAQQKLILVLDLDHTLLNSIQTDHLSELDYQLVKDLYQQEQISQSQQRQMLYNLAYGKIWTKLRPGVWELLEEASKRYQLYIYTHGERAYAAEIQRVLDPDNVLFPGRVIGLEDSTQRSKKDLDIVIGRQELVVILDDSEHVWEKYDKNLITIKRYFFFNDDLASSNGRDGYLRKGTDEIDGQGILFSISSTLTKIHDAFFNSKFKQEDVRKVIAEQQQKILNGLCILFTRVFPLASRVQDEKLWKMAESLGADCVTEIGEHVTHVVAGANGTEKARWGFETGKFVVSINWLVDCFYNWERVDESLYILK